MELSEIWIVIRQLEDYYMDDWGMGRPEGEILQVFTDYPMAFSYIQTLCPDIYKTRYGIYTSPTNTKYSYTILPVKLQSK